MSTIRVANIQHPSAATAAIKLASDGTAGIAALTTNAQSGTTYTFTADDAGRLVTASNASAKTFTIPPQSSVTWAAGAVLNVVNYGAGAVTVAGGVGVTVTNTAKTLAQFESAALIRTAENAWTLVPFSGGVGNADFSDAATDTYTDGGINYKYKTYTGSGSVTITKAGLCDVLVVGGGSGGGSSDGGGGGAGGHLEVTNAYVPSGSLTVVVGAGGTTGLGRGTGFTGGASRIGSYYSPSGGGGGGGTPFGTKTGNNGASGGGGGGDTGTPLGGSAVAGIGNAGGKGNKQGGGGNYDNAGGGGGGAGAVGVDAAAGQVGGAGGAGSANSYTGTSVTRAGGGGGAGGSGGGAGGSGGGGAGGTSGSGTAGTVNTGGGGGGGGTDASGGTGGSGVVVVRIRTA